MKICNHKIRAFLYAFCISTLMIAACSKIEDKELKVPNGLVTIKVGVQNESFAGHGKFEKRSSSKKNKLHSNPPTQRKIIPLTNDLILTAELTPQLASAKFQKLASSSTATSSDTSSLTQNVMYKVVVYDADGKYITERDYSYGNENNTSPLQLDGGRKYVFIAYSVNSTTALPAVEFQDADSKTLSGSKLNLSGDLDFMYFKKEMMVSGADDNYLAIILKHKLCQITTTIDASATGYLIHELKSSLSPHKADLSISLLEGGLTHGGDSKNADVIFPSLGAAKLVSLPTIINAEENKETAYTIATITIGDITQNNITPFSDLDVIPGVKYTMNLTLAPSDEFLTYMNQPAARINGRIWMLHNLGADTNVDPNPNQVTSALHGDYYQWGRKVSVGKGTDNRANSNWIRNNSASNAWNLGTEESPIKTSFDPCPEGYRVPTKTEYDQLIDDVIISSTGSLVESNLNFNSAAVLTSGRKSDVFLLFPLQGFFNVVGTDFTNYQPKDIDYRGMYGYYKTSTAVGEDLYLMFLNKNEMSVYFYQNNPGYRSQSENIRCIAL